IGAVLVHGAKAPKLVSNTLVKKMKPGAVLVDVAIDQGGCFEDSKATTHQDPTYKVHDAIFYCVANMPGAVPATSTYALANATIKYGLALANKVACTPVRCHRNPFSFRRHIAASRYAAWRCLNFRTRRYHHDI
ncbi:MAG: hypothetical protein ACKOBV_10775, partial [Candidatus Kapaibacterium sp.]